MIWNDSLKDISLNELLELLSLTTERLLEAKINEDGSMATLHQNNLELIQKAIISKGAEYPPLK